MPCCPAVLAAALADARTPSWLRRLHAKGGIFVPSHLNIDDHLYGGRPAAQTPPPPTPPPPPCSSNHRNDHVVFVRPEQPTKAAAKPKQPPPPPPQRPPLYPSRPNPRSRTSPPPQPQQELELAMKISDDLVAVPSSAPPSPEAIREWSPPPLITDEVEDQSSIPAVPAQRPHEEEKDKVARGKKRPRAARARIADGDRSIQMDVTVMDTSIDGWKDAKLLICRGDVWKVHDKPQGVIEMEEVMAKGKRRAGLVSKIKRDQEKQKEKEKEKEKEMEEEEKQKEMEKEEKEATTSEEEKDKDKDNDPTIIDLLKETHCYKNNGLIEPVKKAIEEEKEKDTEPNTIDLLMETHCNKTKVFSEPVKKDTDDMHAWEGLNSLLVEDGQQQVTPVQAICQVSLKSNTILHDVGTQQSTAKTNTVTTGTKELQAQLEAEKNESARLRQELEILKAQTKESDAKIDKQSEEIESLRKMAVDTQSLLRQMISFRQDP